MSLALAPLPDLDDLAQTAQEKKIVDHVKSKVEEIRASANRVSNEGVWLTNCAAVIGLDGIVFNTQTRAFQPVNRTSAYLRKNRIHVNKILPTLQNRLARLCKNPPKYDVRPESNDNEDKEAARLALQVLMCLWERLRLDSKRIPLYMWTQQAGHGYIKIAWDPTEGKPMVNPSTNESGYEGEIRADIVSPFEVFPNPAAHTWEEVKKSWLIHCKVRKLDYFKSQYPGKGDQVKEEPTWLLSLQYENRINSMNTRGPSTGNQDHIKQSAVEMIKYEARSKDYPNGRMIIVANGILLEDKELPVGEIPYEKFDDIVVAGKLYPEAVVTHLRPIQDQYNETIRRRAEWVKKLLAGKYVSPRGNGLAQEALNDESGEILMYDPVPNAPNGGEPHALTVPMIPQFAYQEEDRLNLMFNDISGVMEIDKGVPGQAGLPAIGMQLLTENSDTRIGIMTEQHEHAWAGVGTLILKYVQRFYVLPRKIKIAGKSLEYTVRDVSGEDIRDNTDVSVIRGSTLPGSKSLRRQEILNAYTQGLLGDPMDPKVREKVLGLIEFGDVQGIYEDYAIDMAQINRGIKDLEAGLQVQANKLDNHPLWMQELNKIRKGDKFLSYSPEIQQNILGLIEQHNQWILTLSNAVPPLPPQLPPNMAAGSAPVPPAIGLHNQPGLTPIPPIQPPQGALPL